MRDSLIRRQQWDGIGWSTVVSIAPAPTRLTAHDHGVEGARRRWGKHGRILRLDKLDPATKELVCLLLDAAQAKRDAETVEP